MNSIYEELVDSLIQDGYLKTPEIIDAFRGVDRADFVPDEFKKDAYINSPLPIGFGQTISQPLVVAFMLELLQAKPGEKILDVGCGSGWTTALLACIASKMQTSADQNADLRGSEEVKEGKLLVVGIERIFELKILSETNVRKYNFIEKGVVKIIKGDGSTGYKKESPYDRILAGAAAEGNIPKAWKDQLKVGGRIVSPVGPNITVIDKTGQNQYNQKNYFGFSFVPLIKG